MSEEVKNTEAPAEAAATDTQAAAQGAPVSGPVPTPGVEQPAAPDLNISDLNAVKSIIDIATTRGAFKANELEAVGKTYNNNKTHKEITMAKEIKHVGKLKNTGDKVAVVFRTVPGESNHALILPVATLKDEIHDSLMKMIDSDQGQETNELGELMFSRTFPDGRPMLQAMEAEGRLKKMATDNIIMTPTPVSEIALSELNGLIAEQKGMTVDTLYTLVSGAPKEGAGDTAPAMDTLPSDEPVAAPSTDGALSDSDLAKSLRSQADSMYKEAARMRREADDLDPPKKKTSSKVKAEAEA